MIAPRRNGYHHARCLCELTNLERRILDAYAHGLNRRRIGARFGLSERTVGRYLTVAKEKLGADTLVQAALLAARGTASS